MASTPHSADTFLSRAETREADVTVCRKRTLPPRHWMFRNRAKHLWTLGVPDPVPDPLLQNEVAFACLGLGE